MGDAVNVAARLQARGPARQRHRRRGDLPRRPGTAIAYERLEPLELKGKEEPVPGLGGDRGDRRAAARRPRRSADAADRARARRPSCCVSLVERVEREGSAPPGDRDRPGGGRQVAAAARARPTRSAPSDDPPTIRRGQCPPYGPASPTGPWSRSSASEFELLDTDGARGRLGEAAAPASRS